MSGSRSTGKVNERAWSGRVYSLFSNARSPPYCCAVFLNPRIKNGECVIFKEHALNNDSIQTHFYIIVSISFQNQLRCL